MVSNHRPTGYEPVALPLSYEPAETSLSPLRRGVKKVPDAAGSLGPSRLSGL